MFSRAKLNALSFGIILLIDAFVMSIEARGYDIATDNFISFIRTWQSPRTQEEAIDALESALMIEPQLTEWPFPGSRIEFKGGLLRALAKAYGTRKWGLRADNMEAQIKVYQDALAVYASDAFPKQWALTLNDLGNSYVLRIHGDRAENVEHAIELFTAALTIRTRESAPVDWAQTEHDLALAYISRERGDIAANHDKAIELYKAALAVRTRDSLPEQWAMTQNMLCSAFIERIHGDRADNLELAIRACELALTVRTRQDFSRQWAVTEANLGLAFRRRIVGDRANNLEQSISAFKRALFIWQRYSDSNAMEAEATVHDYLGAALVERIRGDRDKNLEDAIREHRNALGVRQREFNPWVWASTQANLGRAFIERKTGDRGDNLELAIQMLEESGSVLTRETVPNAWAYLEYLLAKAYSTRVRGERDENRERAIKLYRDALTVFTPERFPLDHLRAARELGNLLLSKHDWCAAREIYASARGAFLLLFGQGLDEPEAKDLIENAGPLFAEAAYVAAEVGDRKGAFNLLNEGKARLMAVALRQQTLNLSSEEHARYSSLKIEVQEQTRIAQMMHGVEGTRSLTRLVELRRELGDLLQKGLPKSSDSETAALISKLLSDGGAIVAPIITAVGGKLVIVTATTEGPTISIVDLPGLTTSRLDTLLRGNRQGNAAGGWLAAYGIQYLSLQVQRSRIGEWGAAVEAIGPTLWTLFAGPLDAELQRLHVGPGGRLIWLPAGALGLLPLELARDPASDREFINSYEIVYAPSVEALDSASRQLAQASKVSLAEVVNPTGNLSELNLPFAEIEGALVATHFAGGSVIRLDKSNATPEAVLTALKEKSYWHFSSHGFFDWSDARKSGLRMKDDQPLTVGALLHVEGTVGAPRLVVMSACESGLFDTSRSPDEFVGLPATLMQLGAAGVLSALWQVDDLATALLTAKFYDLHLDGSLAPPAALRGAQAWLRNASRAELIAFARSETGRAHLAPSKLAELERAIKPGRRSGDTRSSFWNMLHSSTTNTQQSHPFAHPYYWGGFVYTGL
jgi:CHAT domain-containing protein/tetratricopeptide (TPR) repeat protein